MPELYIYELDPTGGYCGFPAEIPGLPPAELMRRELIRRNKITKQIKNQLKIDVKRIFLRKPGLIDNPIVKAYVKETGVQAFPVFLYNNKIIHAGSFPDPEILLEKIRKIDK
ncbi:MAG: hypothetical protein ACTSYB_07480 [Candidatus Helarchaeota archaeon]